jgi:conjugal transfer ATP-binding protein TraC
VQIEVVWSTCVIAVALTAFAVTQHYKRKRESVKKPAVDGNATRMTEPTAMKPSDSTATDTSEKKRGPAFSSKRRRVASRIAQMLKHENLANLFPQQTISDDGVVFFSDMHIGMMHIGMPASGADATTVKRLHSALNAEMPAGTFISFHLLNTPHIKAQVEQYTRARETISPDAIQLDPLLMDLPKKRGQFFMDMAEGKVPDQINTTNTALLIVCVKIPCDEWPVPADQKQLVLEVAARVSEACAAAAVPVIVCDAPLYHMVMRRILRPFEPLDHTYSEKSVMSGQFVPPGFSVDATATGIVLDNEVFVRHLQPYALPDEMMLSVMAHLPGDPSGLSNQINCPFMISTVMHYPERSLKLRQIKSKRNKLMYQALGPMRKWNAKIDRMLNGLELLTRQLEEKNDLPVEMNFSAMLFHRDNDALTRETSRVVSYWGGFNFQMAPERNVVFPSFWNAMPHMASSESIINSFRFSTMNTSCAVQFLPILGEWQGTHTAKRSLFSTRRGKPFLFDLFDPANTNYSAVLCAESGAGKGVLAQQLAIDHLSLGGRLWVLDIGYTYKKLNSLLGGEYVEFNRNSPVNCNPFLYVDDIDDSMEVLRTVIGKMISPKASLDSIAGGMARGYIEEAIKSCWGRYQNTTTPTSIAEFLRAHPDTRANDLATMMFPWTRSGGFGSWFEGSKPIDFNNQFTVLEMQDLREMPQLLDVLLVLLINRINAKMREDAMNPNRAKKLIYADEAWEVLNNDGTAGYLAAAARTLRKEEGGIVVIVQSVADLYGSPSGRAIAGNAATKIVMQQTQESINYVRKEGMLALTEYWWEQLKSVHTSDRQFSEVMFINRSGVGIARLQLDRFMQVVTSTKGAARTEVLNDIERGVPALEAIEQFIEREQVAA